MTILAEVADPDGRRVQLLQEDWDHIVGGHPEMSVLQAEVLRAVEAPARRQRERGGEEWFYLADVGPSSFIKVVVVFEAEGGRIITAFPRRAFP